MDQLIGSRQRSCYWRSALMPLCLLLLCVGLRFVYVRLRTLPQLPDCSDNDPSCYQIQCPSVAAAFANNPILRRCFCRPERRGAKAFVPLRTQQKLRRDDLVLNYVFQRTSSLPPTHSRQHTDKNNICSSACQLASNTIAASTSCKGSTTFIS